ncbi:MAG: serine hydrolase [Prevotellaceae bacterium]|jgi:CubicO group peptidase (beta-lactamase class C family)/lysophospholipase L1-like esterase|nr:serine hydrolase [Prevotellaceae bacterium]
MKHLLNVCLLALVALQAGAQALPRVAPELMGVDSHRLAYADSAILESIANKEIPGAVLAVVKEDRMIYLKAYGNKEVYPKTVAMDVNTVFDMASCSKSMSTAVSAWILLERGKMRLLDPVSMYIPDYQDYTDSLGRRTTIRIVHLLTHTSGLPAYGPTADLVAKYGSPNPDGMIEYIATCPREFKPETDFQYSCLNYISLQRIIETISGQSLRDFAKENIFDVLGMKHTDYNPTGETLERVAPTEVQKDGTVLRGQVHDPLARLMMGGISGNAGIFSDANDIAILVAALMNGGAYNGKRILSPMAVRAMTTVPRGLIGSYGRTPGWDVFSDYASNNGDLFGRNTYGHTGYTGTSIIVDPDQKVSVILLTDRVHPKDVGSVVRLRSVVANAVAGAIGCPPERVYFPYYYQRVGEFAEDAPITKKDIVMLGNSITEGGGERFATLTKTKHVRNRGISGDVAMGVYDRLDQILPGQPKKIFLMIGINDVSQDLTAEEIVSHIEMVVDKVRKESPKTRLYLESLMPINESFGRYERLTGKTSVVVDINHRLEALAKAKDIPFLNFYSLFAEPNTDILRQDLTEDGLHLNDTGYVIWTKALKKYM